MPAGVGILNILSCIYKEFHQAMKRYLKNYIFFLLFTSALQLHAQKPDAITEKSVTIESGQVSGVIDKSVKVFRGIPYAAPPIGNNRWRAPEPVATWSGIKPCSKFGPNAMQGAPVPFSVYTEEYLIPAGGDMSEDCLYLNIWTDATRTNEKRPVVVFIHGGGFTGGSGSVVIYDGVAMAKKGVVFVTINYRLGLFGFLAHPALQKESTNGMAAGNYGIMDQVTALQWVQKNIQQFGGDPRNVTIAGQSAGAHSVNVLSATPLAKGLFQKMIAESGGRVVKGLSNIGTLAEAEEKAVQFMHAAGASSLEELRTMPASKLMAAYKGQGGLIVDGYVLKEPVYSVYEKRAQVHVPLLTGYNEGDGASGANTTIASYKEMVAKLYGTDSSHILQLYPAGTQEEAKHSFTSLTRDRQYGAQNYTWAKMQSEESPVFMYYFKRKVPENAAASAYSAFHTAEAPYAYGNLQYVKRPFTIADTQLSETMLAYWVNFAKTGNPNGNGLPLWPGFSAKENKVILLDSTISSGIHPGKEGVEYIYQKSIAQ